MQAQSYRQGEALTGYMTAAQWLRRFDPTTLEHIEDPEADIAELERLARKEAKQLRLPVPKDGTFAPSVFELAYRRAYNC